MNDSMVPVKLPMKPIKIAKCGMITAMNTEPTITQIRTANPHIFKSPSGYHMVGKTVSGLPRNRLFSIISQAA